jgi:hypothetical protein
MGLNAELRVVGTQDGMDFTQALDEAANQQIAWLKRLL